MNGNINEMRDAYAEWLSTGEHDPVSIWDMNPDNEYECSNCPHNKGSWNTENPCGFMRCWVTQTCNVCLSVIVKARRSKMENVEIVNLTPHDVTIVTDSGNITIEASGEVARCEAFTINDGGIIIDGIDIPITSTEMGKVTGLPEETEGTCYIVSRVVAEACKDRSDLLIPNESVRDSSGRIIGCKSLAVIR